MIIEISNLHLNVIEKDLQRLFTPFGEIRSIEIMRDRLTNRPRGKAFVDMPVEKEAKQAVLALHGSRLANKIIAIILLPFLPTEDQVRTIL